MSRINRQPAGILGFLGIKNTGRNPENIAQTLAPTWDMAGLYLIDAAEYLTREDNISANGTVITDGPSLGEVWYVHEFGCRSGNLAVGETINFGLGFLDASGTVFVPLADKNATNTVAADRAIVACPRPVILRPGEACGVFVTDITTASQIPIYTSMRFTRMRV